MIRLLTLLFTLLLAQVGSTLPSDCSDHEMRIDLLEEKVHKLESIVGKLLSKISVDKEIETEHHHVRREVLSQGLEGLEGLEGLLNKLSEDGSLQSLKGKDGKDGVNGEQGQQGPPGRDGLPGIQGQSGVQGPPGPPGSPGAPGNCSMVCQRQDPAPYKKYYSQKNIDSYLRASNIPAMKELTACFYYEPNEYSQIDAALKDKRLQMLISIRSAASDNDFGVGLWYGTLGGYRSATDPSFSSHLDSFLKPHRHCFVWSSGSNLKWFYGMHAPGQLELVGQIKDTNHPRNATVLDGSILVLLNDQDTHGGGLEAGQMAAGNIADFQMWNRAFSDDEVRALGCSERGNIVTFHEMETVGPATFQQGGNFRCTI